jgi:pentatricopeptide repeat protein
MVSKRHRLDPKILTTHSSGAGDYMELPGFMRRRVPPATIETFSILVQYYLRRGKFREVEKLSRHLQLAEIKPNSFYMNHLLYSLLRGHGQREAWQMYTNMTHEGGVQPDVSTFACLWDCMKIHVDKLRNRDKEGFPEPRRLFHEMVAWFPKWRARDLEEVSKELYDQIIRCFSLAEDQVGTLVALHALKDMFGIHPDQATARIIVLQIARLGAPDPRSKRLNLSTSNTKTNIAKVMNVLEKLAQRRNAILEQGDIQGAENNAVRKTEETLWLVSELLRVVITRGLEVGKVTEELRNAATEMGVEDGESIKGYLNSIV